VQKLLIIKTTFILSHTANNFIYLIELNFRKNYIKI